MLASAIADALGQLQIADGLITGLGVAILWAVERKASLFRTLWHRLHVAPQAERIGAIVAGELTRTNGGSSLYDVVSTTAQRVGEVDEKVGDLSNRMIKVETTTEMLKERP